MKYWATWWNAPLRVCPPPLFFFFFLPRRGRDHYHYRKWSFTLWSQKSTNAYSKRGWKHGQFWWHQQDIPRFSTVCTVKNSGANRQTASTSLLQERANLAHLPWRHLKYSTAIMQDSDISGLLRCADVFFISPNYHSTRIAYKTK